MAMEKYLECGRVNNTHGVSGLLRAEHWCDGDAAFCALPAVYVKRGGDMVKYDLESATPHGRVVLVRLAGVGTVEEAMAFKGVTLYADRADMQLPEGKVFVADLIGVPVKNILTGEVIGKLGSIINRGASDISVVATPDGEERMIPAVDEFVASVGADCIEVRPIEGMV